MAKYEISEGLTKIAEGGYANNKADTGGRTLNGISYNNWPKWPGWPKLMAIINKVGENARLINTEVRKDAELLNMINQFYKQNFWDTLSLDKFEDQQLANTVYDFGVNSGTGRAAKFLQEAVGVKQDGKIGPQTLAAVNIANPQTVHTAFNKAREDAYRSWAKGNQAQFLRSWLSRLQPYNEMKMIQYRLGLSADGVYGPNTKEAIADFQKANGLTPDGIPGEKTMEAFYRS